MPETQIRKIPTEIYTRICGYFRPTAQANAGKKEEIKERKLYIVPEVSGEKFNRDRRGECINVN
jgi:hypothetical protein